MKTRTLKAWNKKGRWVIKGEKALSFNKKGKALFAKDQTYKPVSYAERYDKDCTAEFIDAFGVDHSDVADLPCGY
jgi:hypothetical protein